MLTLTVACGAYDRVRPLFDGRVQVEGARVVPVPLASEQSFPRAVTRAEFDVTELSLSSQLVQLSRGEAAYVALPIPVARAFRHGCIYLRRDAAIASPKDLEGRRVGVPEYGMTLALWLRGILADEHGVATDAMIWRTAGTNLAGRKERLVLELPQGVDVRPLPEGTTLNEALLAGELDAVLSPTPPSGFISGDPRVTRLFPDPRGAAEAYYRRTGFFPTMHLIGVRRDVIARAPGLGFALYRAFYEAKCLAEAEWQAALASSSPATMFPFLAEEWATTQALLGPEPWRYGFAANRAEFEALCRWSHAQHLARRVMRAEELFDPRTLNS
ncbi:ABC transporter substrate-binding protein [Roseomonas xinghualingensis]|uniref:ABC transporter substrate-binding protein n=1 Tax=Roseomonas xinghualingensis TaxID=2986475 RepID=UPI0021F11688|nr:ABC transporter substrate-binding protein [Roseomonas sp. SXEYE001]MCV4210273.1 ABC transporter substrate-binding protein [Roseomonas sp. SXEYE001]